MNDVEAPKATTSGEDSSGLWSELLNSSRLKEAGLKIETLAEQVGVSAAYLRLLRQGKRSPSTETAERLFKELGYRVETHDTDSGTDFVARDDKGNVRRWTAKVARGAGSSLERALLQKILDKTTTLEERAGWLQEWDAWYRGEVPEPVPARHSAEPSEGRRLWAWLRDKEGSGAPVVASLQGMSLMGLAAVAGPATATVTARARVAKLLQALPDDDLPLAEAYLALLVDRSQTRPSRQAKGTPAEGGEGARGD